MLRREMWRRGDAAYGGFSDKRHAGELFASRLHGENKAGAGVCASRATAAAACRTGERRRLAVLLGDGGAAKARGEVGGAAEMGPLQWRERARGGRAAGASPVGPWARLVDRIRSIIAMAQKLMEIFMWPKPKRQKKSIDGSLSCEK